MHSIVLSHTCGYAPTHGCAACHEIDLASTYGERDWLSDRLVRNLEDGALVFVGIAAMVAFVWNAI